MYFLLNQLLYLKETKKPGSLAVVCHCGVASLELVCDFAGIQTWIPPVLWNLPSSLWVYRRCPASRTQTAPLFNGDFFCFKWFTTLIVFILSWSMVILFVVFIALQPCGTWFLVNFMDHFIDTAGFGVDFCWFMAAHRRILSPDTTRPSSTSLRSRRTGTTLLHHLLVAMLRGEESRGDSR